MAKPQPSVRQDDEYSAAEAARRRDAVVKRMLDTKPQPRTQPKVKAKGRRRGKAAKRA